MIYRTATSPADYRACHALLRELDREEMRMSFPTIMALEDKQLVGFLATFPSDDAVMTGPIAIRKGRNRGWIAIKLFDAYEGMLRFIGVKKYLIQISKSNMSLVRSVGRLFEQEPVAENENEVWFVRDLIDDRQHSGSS